MVSARIKRLAKEKEIRDGVADQLAYGSGSKDGSLVLGVVSVEELDAFVANYEARVGALDAAGQAAEMELAKLNGRVEELRRSMAQSGSRTEKVSAEVAVLLDGQSGGAAELTLTYVVRQASWTASYDARLLTDQGDGRPPKLHITYYAKVKQSTGEDWENAALSLSTAKPAHGAVLPDLPTMRVAIRVPTSVTTCVPSGGLFGAKSGAGAFGGGGGGGGGGLFGPAPPAAGAFGGFAFSAQGEAPPPPPMPTQEVQVSGGMLSTTYEIRRRSTIPSDGASHKVTVGLAELSPRLTYTCVVGKSAAVFVHAEAVNTSELALLKGPVSVFLDADFVAKSEVPETAAGAELKRQDAQPLALLKVTASPLSTKRQETGLVAKWSVEERSRSLSVANSHSAPLLLTILEQVPVSQDEKVKVTLHDPKLDKEPPAKEAEGARLNDAGNLEWSVAVEGKAARDLRLRYTIEWPLKEILAFNQDSLNGSIF